MLTDPRFYNIRWLELLSEVTPQIDQFGPHCERGPRPDHRRRGPAGLRPRGHAAGRRGGPRAVPRRLDVTDDAAVARGVRRVGPDARVQLRRLPQRGGLRARGGPGVRGQRAGGQAAGDRCAEDGARFVHLSTNYVFDGTAAEPYDEDDAPYPRSIYAISKLAGSTPRWRTHPAALVVRTAGLYGLHGSASKGGNFVTRMIARASEQGALKVVADQRLTPDLHGRPGGRDPGRGRGGRRRARSPDQRRATARGTSFTEAIMELAGVDVAVAAGDHGHRARRGRPPAQRRACGPRLGAGGLAPLRPWRDALARRLGPAGPARRRACLSRRRRGDINSLEAQLEGPMLLEPP